MKQSTHSGLRALLALPLTFVTVAALAQSGSPADLNRVEVSGQKLPTITRFDVRATCPDLEKSLQKSLAAAWFKEERPGVVDVQFKLKGKEITEAHAQGSYFAYNTPVRRAVRTLDCSADMTQEQLFKFQVVFLADDERRGSDHIAMVELKQ